MKRLSIAIFVLFVCFTTLYSQTYYVSSSSGSDNHNGLSESSPWQTISKVNLKTFKPGDRILFKSGDLWEGEQLVIDHSGTATNRITYSSYESGLKPIITLKGELPGWTVSGNWTAVSGLTNVWVMNITFYASVDRLWLNGTEAKMAWDYVLKTYIPSGNTLYKGDNGDGTTGVCSAHQFYYERSNDKFYLYSIGNPATYYSSIEYPGAMLGTIELNETVSLRNADYVTIDGLDIQGSLNASLGISGSDYVTITNCNIGKYSNWIGVVGDNGKASDKTSDYVTISNCTVDSDWDYDYVYYTSRTPYGVLMQDVPKGGATYWDVHDNIIKDWWMNIFVAGNDSSGATQYHNIHNNEITAPRFSFSKAAQISSGGTSKSPPTYTNFYDNYIHDIVFGIQVSSIGNKFYYNIFKDLIIESTNEHSSSGGWMMQMIGDGQQVRTSDNYVFNNTIYNTIEYACLYDKYDNNNFYNNLYVMCGKNSSGIATRSDYFSTATYKNNLFFYPSATTSSKMVYLNTIGTYTVTEWNAANGTYGKTISGNLQHVGAIENLMNISNFALPSGSPALNGGTSIESLVPEGFTDRFGNVVDRKNPSIGAVDNSELEPTGFKIYLQGTYVNGSMKTDLKFTDLIPKSQPYNISPWNYSGNESVAALPLEIVDWVLVELRSDISSSSIAAKRATFVKSDGSIVGLDGLSKLRFDGVSSGNYYIVVRHRNHLSIMSANKVSLNESFLFYDFTTSRSTAFGNDLADLGNEKYGMYAGDGDANGNVNVLDYGSVGNNLFQTGYLPGDYDLNGTVNVLDYGRTNQNLLKISNVP